MTWRTSSQSIAPRVNGYLASSGVTGSGSGTHLAGGLASWLRARQFSLCRSTAAGSAVFSTRYGRSWGRCASSQSCRLHLTALSPNGMILLSEPPRVVKGEQSHGKQSQHK